MPNITYNNDIPLRTDSPSTDQSLMKQNTNAVDTLLQVDHYSFNTSGGTDDFGGHHQFVKLPERNGPGATAGFASAVYSATGVANTNTSNLLYKNASTSYILSSLKCLASIATVNPGTLTTTAINYLNINPTVSITGDGKTYTIDTTNAFIVGSQPIIIVSMTSGSFTYSYSANQLTIVLTSAGTGRLIGFTIFQV